MLSDGGILNPAFIRRRIRPAFRLAGEVLRRPLHAARFLAFLISQRALAHRTNRELRIVVRAGGMGDVLWAATACEASRQHHRQALYVLLTRPQDEAAAQFAAPGLATFGLTIPAPLIYPIARCFGAVIELVYADERSILAEQPQHFYLDFLDALNVPHPEQPEHIRWPRSQPASIYPQAIYLATEATWAVRRYPRPLWQKIIEDLRTRLPHPIIQIVALDSAELPLKGCDAHLAGLSLPELCERFHQATLVITVDSFMMHLAWGSGARIIALFGPTNPLYRVFPSSRFIALHADLDCQFCHHRRPRLHWESGCPNDITCMNDIAPGRVVEAAAISCA